MKKSFDVLSREANAAEQYVSQQDARDAINRSLIELWRRVSGQNLSAVWQSSIDKWARRYGFDTVAKAMHSAKSIEQVGIYAEVSFRDQQEPGSRQCYLIRGVLRKRVGRIDERRVLNRLLEAMRAGKSLDWLMDLAKRVGDIGEFDAQYLNGPSAIEYDEQREACKFRNLADRDE